ncbi:uncharacterized protein LOC123716700 [Pieris brassicae]|uniref:uncharacterized protein LOC123716700 n=1 Tax=Pieris brassicae TaxID=7116 RepID=UPI001E65F20E|nr:uncharacterized protein LOC123716700 [Pieris brassicae]
MLTMHLYIIILFVIPKCFHAAANFWDRSNHLRHDGGLCFEIPPWQHQPVEVEEHLNKLKDVLGKRTDRRQFRTSSLLLVNNEINRYMSTVIAPFLDTYHRGIQNNYRQLTRKILKQIKDEVVAAIREKEKIYKELIELADTLKVPEMCDEERRAARTLASKHVAKTYQCTEEARASITEMGIYAEEMINITKRHMQVAVADATQNLDETIPKANVTMCLREISRVAASLGYELDLSLTNARRHNTQSSEKLTKCCVEVRINTGKEVKALSEYLYQCVYA